MINFIAKNYEWLFSGLGVLVISIILGLLKKKRDHQTYGNKVKTIETNNSNDPFVQASNNLVKNSVFINEQQEGNVIEANEAEVYLEVQPIDIIDAVQKAPPFHQKSIEESYIGQKVNWVVDFISIRSDDNNKYHIISRYKKSYPWIYFDVDIECYPIFKIANKDDEFCITGKIIEVSGHDIRLDVSSIKKLTSANK
ncbi:MAG: hypothetical protein M0Q12_08045 [Synergistaceae bacterium]|jgi:hypothetical protein|nr:hypothetical protein [Synergistaceae bacterium]MDD2284730.1 hypothetical protein [Paludibacter sp.]